MASRRWIYVVRLALLWMGFLSVSACGQSTTNVSLHGVNYSGEPFRYYVMDLDKPQIVGGGELVEPYGAGGTMCCASLPRKWRPGIKLKVKTVHWLKKRADGELPEIQEEHSIEVPPYVDGKPGELWVVREKDGKIGAISSDYQPDHLKWPGKVKGWPIPSIEYRRERWLVLMRYEESGLRLYTNLLDELAKNPSERARKAWEYTSKNNPEELEAFAGETDPNFLKYLRAQYEDGLERSKRLIRELEEVRP